MIAQRQAIMSYLRHRIDPAAGTCIPHQAVILALVFVFPFSGSRGGPARSLSMALEVDAFARSR